MIMGAKPDFEKMVPSKYMREYLKDKKEFTDWEKATLIWNSTVCTWKERMDLLKQLSERTSDVKLKIQIAERFQYEETAYQLFIENQNNQFVYVVFDTYRDASGYFSEYEMARKYGMRECEKYGGDHFFIEKQLLFGQKTKENIIKPWISDKNILKGSIFCESEYDGRENVWANYDKNGGIRLFYSMEMSAEDNTRVDTMDRNRFEYRFFKIPFGMETGTIVKSLYSGTYFVLECGEDDWNDYMNRTDADPSYYDFSDIQVIVFGIQKDGHWSHDHVNPMYLELELPKKEDGNKESEAHIKALKALSEYFKKNTKESSEKAIIASRDYADSCLKHSSVYEVDDIKKLLF